MSFWTSQPVGPGETVLVSAANLVFAGNNDTQLGHASYWGLTFDEGNGGLSAQGGSNGNDDTWYTGSINQTSIIRDNVFTSGVTGSISLTDRISNALIENNVAPSFAIQGPDVNDTLVRGNKSNAGGAPSIDNQSPGTLVLP